MRVSQETTYEEVCAEVHEFARVGLRLGVEPVRVLAVCAKKYELYFLDHRDELDDIVACELRRFWHESGTVRTPLEWRVDAPWSCASCQRIESRKAAVYVGWAFVNSRTGEPYAFCEDCYFEFCAAEASRQRQMLDLVALRLTCIGAHA